MRCPSAQAVSSETRPSAATVAERAFARARVEAGAAQGRPLRLRAAPEVVARLRAGASRLGRVELAAELSFAREQVELEPA